MNPLFRYAAVTAVLGAIIMLLLDKVVMPFYVREGSDRYLPDVTGMPLEQAKSSLELEGFEAKRDNLKYTNAYSAGTVIDQYPDAMKRVKPGRTVYLTVAERERMVEVPDLLGKSLRSGKLELSEVGLKIDSLIAEYDADVPVDVIRWQYPRFGDFLRRGSGLTVIISKGKPPDFYEVPNVFGLSLEKAEELLAKTGLAVGGVTYRQNEDLVPYTVLDQSIEAGTILDKPVSLYLTVSILDLSDIRNQLGTTKRE
ncbi:MAG: PASTA domain-containing protein [Candidatus Neomarinimicrobiota bacterium]|nr:PASTA domain-containing protein [Candidatus Neomarinimicrobiota bacterium]